ncbi:MAG: carbohydrate-binding protein [Clostridiaceae bacterium]|nr:carbohydrate-binding protein [Clostridiaceae bacterium]
MQLEISIINKEGRVICCEKNISEVCLVYNGSYEEGDAVVIKSSKDHVHLAVQIDDAMGESQIYLTTRKIKYFIPFGEKRFNLSPKAFCGELHYLFVRAATQEEIYHYRNLAVNRMDQLEENGCYPHAEANVATRGEAVFAARNAIDGIVENRSHGHWPYTSWGINQQEDAEIQIEFGREVLIDKLVLYTRADFPHDNWWKQITVTFSDESKILWDMKKSYKPHVKKFKEKYVRWVKLSNLIKDNGPSPFPALSQIHIFGRDLKFLT